MRRILVPLALIASAMLVHLGSVDAARADCGEGQKLVYVSELSDDETITISGPEEFAYHDPEGDIRYRAESVGVGLPYRLARDEEDPQNLEKSYAFRYIRFPGGHVVLFGSTVFWPHCR